METQVMLLGDEGKESELSPGLVSWVTRLRGHHHGVKGGKWVEVVVMGAVYFVSFSPQLAGCSGVLGLGMWFLGSFDRVQAEGGGACEKTVENIFSLLQLRTTYL